MAHIVEFSVKGLAGRKEDISLTLNRDINVFFGLNGSGKTSLLKILHSAMSNDASILKDVPFLEAKVVIYSIDDNKNYEYKIKKEFLLTPSKKSKGITPELLITRAKLAGVDPKNYQMYLESLSNQTKWDVSPATDTKLWRHRYLPISRLYVGSVSTRREQILEISEDQLDARFSEILQQIWMRYSYDINSRVREAQEVGLANILRELLSPTVTAK
jgi:predicted ATP-dependent endonuclease of OLD family